VSSDLLEGAKPRISIEWKKPTSSDEDAARRLINRVHYQQGKIYGEFIIGFTPIKQIASIRPSFVPNWTSGDICLVGAAVLKNGITHGNPKGRRDLAAKHFPELKLNRMDRGEIVSEMALARISRVAVEPELHGLGIGRALAMECRKKASQLVPGSQYIEVMTSQRLKDAKRLLTKEAAKSDFLQAAGFRLAPFFTKIQKPLLGRDRRLYYWASAVS
jgi:GNAT superfamily N-acetyltransferase